MNGPSCIDLSVVVVSYNTRDVLRHCLHTLRREAGEISYETLVVDNASCDGSADMVQTEFPDVRLIRSPINLGFAAGNNRAFPLARGRYVVLLNSDAFLCPGSLPRALEHMEKNPDVGLGGGRLIGRDGAWQPSARMFPSPLNDFLCMSGLAARYTHSRFFGRFDRTWADPLQASEVDWVPGAFAIIRRHVLAEVGYFDEAFFLYYEEVDLCRRMKSAGYRIWYWPDILVVHLGGESSKTVRHLSLSEAGSQLTLWRMRSALLYYRKHHGPLGAWLGRAMETLGQALRAWKNSGGGDPGRRAKAKEAVALIRLLRQAWQDTRGGLLSPTRPW
jgi:GT2 family glycosyltransferase